MGRRRDRTGTTVVKSDEQWRAQLSPQQYRVLRRGGTERPHRGAGSRPDGPASYRCAGCAAVLFDAATKYDSGTGWPSFTAPVDEVAVLHVRDVGLLGVRTEVRCRSCAGHLGHVFRDGPRPTGLRYCMNAVALELVAGQPRGVDSDSA